MGNLSNKARLITARIDKGGLDEKSFISILDQDNDFSENYREDTLDLGFKNEAERVSKEIFDECKMSSKIGDDEFVFLQRMLMKLFKIDGFIGQSSYYGDYEYEVVETDFEYVVIIATIM
jgi:hypothetical protein